MDIRKLKTILELFENSDLVEMEFSEGEEKIRLSKSGGGVAASPAISPPAPPPAQPPAGERAFAAADEAATKEEVAGAVVSSPMVGTFYRSAAPDRPPFVTVGQETRAGETLCIVEAMKLMNEIPAPVTGKVKEIYVENGAAVGYGDKLFLIA